MTRHALVQALQSTEAIKYGKFQLAQGGTSEYYIDKYVFETDPQCLHLIAEEFADHLASNYGEEELPKLAGVALGAVPLVAVTSIETGIPYVIARKQEKEHGTGNRIEGNLEVSEEIVILEDIATTGQSAIDAAESLRAAGATVDCVLVVVDREEGGAENLAAHDLELSSLITATELLDTV